MEWLGNNLGGVSPKQSQLFEVTSDDIKSIFEWIMNVEKVGKTNDNLYCVEIDWLKYYVSYISKKYNLDTWYDKENTLVMDAAVIMWVINVDKTTKSSWVVFVSKDSNETYLQFAYYDREIDKVLINGYNNNLEIAYNAVEKFKSSI